MSRKSFIGIIAVVAVMFFVSGCSTVPKKFREEVSGIKSKVDTLESRVEGMESKQAEVERLANEQAQAVEEMRSSRSQNVQTNVSIKTRVPGATKKQTREIQTCLKNAGFYNGKIDGSKGRKTKKAVKEFQKANGLKADGVVGPKTWELLSKYASGGAASAGVNEEGTTK